MHDTCLLLHCIWYFLLVLLDILISGLISVAALGALVEISSDASGIPTLAESVHHKEESSVIPTFGASGRTKLLTEMFCASASTCGTKKKRKISIIQISDNIKIINVERFIMISNDKHMQTVEWTLQTRI